MTTAILGILGRGGDTEGKLDDFVRQVAADLGVLRDDVRRAVSSNDQNELANASNRLGTYAQVVEWAARPGVNWETDTPEILTPPGRPSF